MILQVTCTSSFTQTTTGSTLEMSTTYSYAVLYLVPLRTRQMVELRSLLALLSGQPMTSANSVPFRTLDCLTTPCLLRLAVLSQGTGRLSISMGQEYIQSSSLHTRGCEAPWAAHPMA